MEQVPGYGVMGGGSWTIFFKKTIVYPNKSASFLTKSKVVLLVASDFYGQWSVVVAQLVATTTCDNRGPWFESGHLQNFYIEHFYNFNCIEKTKIKKKRPGIAHWKNTWLLFRDRERKSHGFLIKKGEYEKAKFLSSDSKPKWL